MTVVHVLEWRGVMAQESEAFINWTDDVEGIGEVIAKYRSFGTPMSTKWLRISLAPLAPRSVLFSSLVCDSSASELCSELVCMLFVYLSFSGGPEALVPSV